MTSLHGFLQLDPGRDFEAVFLLEVTLRITALLLVAVITIALCRRASAATRHRLWMLAVVGALLLPVVSLCSPRVDVAIPRPSEIAHEKSNERTGQRADSLQSSATRPIANSDVAPVSVDATTVTLIQEAKKQPRRVARNFKHSNRTAKVSQATTLSRRDGARAWRWGDVLFYCWAAAAAGVLMLSAISLLSAKRLVRRAPLVTDPQWLSLQRQLAERLGLDRPVELRRCNLRISPMVWGLSRPAIVLPVDCEDWSADCRAAVLLHELAHIQRQDWPAQMLTQLAVVLYWFHPLVWLVGREVRKESDRAADDLALSTGLSATTYAEQLLHIARSISSQWLHPAPTMARRNSLSQRVTLLLDPHRRRTPLGRKSSLAVGLVATCLVIAVSVVSVTIAQEEPTVENKPPATAAVKKVLTERDRIERALASMVKYKFEDAPLSDVAAQFAKDHGINVVLEEASMANEGISIDTPVYFDLGGIKFEEALRLILEPLHLEAVILDEVLVVTTAIRAEGILDTRIYNLKNLLGVSGSEIQIESLRNVITTCVVPESWEEVGGPGSIAGKEDRKQWVKAANQNDKEQKKRIASRMSDKREGEGIPKQNNNRPANADFKEVLIIRQSQRVHRQIEELFHELRRHFASNSEPTVREQAGEPIRKALDKQVSVEFDDITLKEAVHQLAAQHEILMVIDESALADEGISTDTPIKLNLKGISLRSALRLALQPLELTAAVDGAVLKITTMVNAEELLFVKAYDVNDLMVQADYDPLIELLTTIISPDSWEEVGGPGTIAPVRNREIKGDRNRIDNAQIELPGVLVIRQSDHIHREIAELFREIRSYQVPNSQPTALELAAASIRKSLDRRITTEFNDTPLADAISQLATQNEIRTVIDNAALADEGISTDTPLNLRVKGISLRSTLRLALRRHQLKAVIDGEVLKITTTIKAEEMMVVKAYDVSDLIVPGEFKSLIKTVTTIIAPVSWESVGGPGTVGSVRVKASKDSETGHVALLIVRQTHDVHKKIAALFDDLRRAGQ